jgi:hypothetical protein
MLFLAGLQRIEYVFADPESKDIVLVGPAESWRIDENGAALGLTTGKPALRLDDLLEAFRTVDMAGEGRGISCSIDPSEAGMARLQELLNNRRLEFNAQTAELMRNAVGPQQVTVTGVFPDSHFARVMVAADYLMKRLAMGMEPAPLAEMPGYLELLRSGDQRFTGTTSPRWWLAVNYLPLLRSEDGLSWKLRGPGVKVVTEDAFIDAKGERIASGRVDEVAERWARNMTERYEELSLAMPVFGQLRNCMDMAVVAALVKHYDLLGRVGADFPLIAGGREARGPQYLVPTTVDSHISAVPAGRSWIIGVSGGVELDSWSVLEESQPARLPPLPPHPAERWWWE